MPSFSEIRIGTPRLDLRPLEVGDEPPLFAMHSDPEFMRYGSSMPWESIEQASSLIARDRREMAEGKHIRLGIFRRADGRLVGTCSLFKFDEQCRRAELGYGIARDCWRRGFMTEAVSALIEFAFSTLNLNRLEADIDPRNTASGRSLERLGFLQEGLLRERWIVGGEVSDSAVYGLLAREWRKSRASVVSSAPQGKSESVAMSGLHKGSCLCGAVTFEVADPLPPPDACHCRQCRKHSGHFFVSTDVPRASLTVHGADKVAWYQSSERVRRGFCSICGSSLFWDPIRKDVIGIAMGAFDTPTLTHLGIHIFVAEKGDYYDIADGLPQNQR